MDKMREEFEAWCSYRGYTLRPAETNCGVRIDGQYGHNKVQIAWEAWQSVENAEVRYMDAALRHLNAHRRGELVDDESGEGHLAHAACCILFLLDMQERKGGVSDGN